MRCIRLIYWGPVTQYRSDPVIKLPCHRPRFVILHTAIGPIMQYLTGLVMRYRFQRGIYHQTCNISRTSAGNQIVDHKDVGAVGAAPNTSSFLTQHLVLWCWYRQLQDETRNIEVWGFGAAYIRCFPVYRWNHRPYSRQVTERMGCNVVIHPPPSIYPKAGNGALRDQWAIKYNCQNDSSIIAFTVRDLVHWNYVISQNTPRVCKSWKSLSIYVFAAYIFFCSPDTQSTEVNFR